MLLCTAFTKVEAPIGMALADFVALLDVAHIRRKSHFRPRSLLLDIRRNFGRTTHLAEFAFKTLLPDVTFVTASAMWQSTMRPTRVSGNCCGACWSASTGPVVSARWRRFWTLPNTGNSESSQTQKTKTSVPKLVAAANIVPSPRRDGTTDLGIDQRTSFLFSRLPAFLFERI